MIMPMVTLILHMINDVGVLYLYIIVTGSADVIECLLRFRSGVSGNCGKVVLWLDLLDATILPKSSVAGECYVKKK